MTSGSQPPPAPQWPPDPYQQQYPYPYPPAPAPTNGMAIASLICAFVFAPLGILFGHISLSQIKRTQEGGRGLAIAGLVVGYLLTVATIVALVLGIVFFAWLARNYDESVGSRYNRDGPTMTAMPTPRADAPKLPAFSPPADLGANCTYTPSATPAAKRTAPPRTGTVPTDPPVVIANMATNAGVVGIALDNGKAPCTINSFVSLAQQGYFDGTTCHRLTANYTLSVLQCGDPSGTGAGGPGYQFADEYPTNQFEPGDPALAKPLLYPRGSLVMANAGSDTNGSQFFIVYQDSKLPPTYTLFGLVDETGMATVDKVAAGGVLGGNKDGKPVTPLTIESVRLE